MPSHTIDVHVVPSIRPACGKRLIGKVARRTLQREGLGQPAEVGVLVTTDEEVHRLNRQYRGIDAATDVLSFSLEEGDGPRNPAPEGVRWLGEVVVSYPRAVSQAAEYGHSVEREVAFLTVHGILHLLGYDHERAKDEAVMRARQEEVLSSLGLTRG